MLKRILIIDDNRDIVDVVREVLSYEKFEVRITTSSNDILEVVKRFHPDMVVMDYKLQVSDGEKICRAIKAYPQLSDIPVIIYSAYLTTNNLLGCGCDAIISKPFGIDELVDKVHNLLEEEIRS